VDNQALHLRAGKSRQDVRCYNLPSSSKIAAIIPGDIGEKKLDRDIIIYPNDGKVQHLSDANKAYIPLYFILMFLRGEAS
jgi:hypothetical protein